MTVNEVNVAPVLGAIGNQTVDELAHALLHGHGQRRRPAGQHADASAWPTARRAACRPVRRSIRLRVCSAGRLPKPRARGRYTFDVVVTDNGTPNLSDSETITVTVDEVNVAPVLGAIGNQTVDELALLSFTATASDVDVPANTLTL